MQEAAVVLAEYFTVNSCDVSRTPGDAKICDVGGDARERIARERRASKKTTRLWRYAPSVAEISPVGDVSFSLRSYSEIRRQRKFLIYNRVNMKVGRI